MTCVRDVDSRRAASGIRKRRVALKLLLAIAAELEEFFWERGPDCKNSCLFVETDVWRLDGEPQIRSSGAAVAETSLFRSALSQCRDHQRNEG